MSEENKKIEGVPEEKITEEISQEPKKKSAFSQSAKVVKDDHWFKKHRATLGFSVVGLIAFLLLVGSHHHKKELQKAAQKEKKIQAVSMLIEQRIKNFTRHKKAAKPKAATVASTVPVAHSKELLTRMRAPTSIYETGEKSKPTLLANHQEKTPEATLMGKGANSNFANEAYSTTSVVAKRVAHPESTIVSGEMLHATLNVATNSDLPGMVTATVTSPAYSYTGENNLIPKGSRLIGQYSSAVMQGQSRIFIMWNRLVLPDGVSVNINSPDTDQIGQSGEPADYVNRHFWSRFGESILMSILSAGVSNVGVSNSDEYNSAQAYRMGIAQSLQQSAAGTLQQTISQKPTLVRYQGSSINVFIAHDLSFYQLRKQQGLVG